MNKLFTLLILTLSLLGFNASSYATDGGAIASDQGQTTAEEAKKKKQKGAEEEEPECE